jgi:hypothetical protein
MGQGANEYNAQSANSEGKIGTITGTFDRTRAGGRSPSVHIYTAVFPI